MANSELDALGATLYKKRRTNDSGMQVLKLVLMGIIAVAIPLLFIIQHDNEKQKDKEADEYKSEIAELKAELSYKNKLIDLIQYNVVKRDTIWVHDTMKGRIIIDYYERNIIYIWDGPRDPSRKKEINEIYYYSVPLEGTMKKQILDYKSSYHKNLQKRLNEDTLKMPIPWGSKWHKLFGFR